MSEVLTDDVVAAVRRHMNEDHLEDSLRIVRGLGGRPHATSARLLDLTAEGAVFGVDGDEGWSVTVGWGRPIAERSDIRKDIVRMHDEACAALGIDPPAVGEHGPAAGEH